MKKSCPKLSREEQFELLCSLTSHLSDPRITSYPKFFTRSVSNFSSRKGKIEFSLKEEENLGLLEFPVQYKGSLIIKDNRKKTQTDIQLKIRRKWTVIDHTFVPLFAVILAALCSLFNFSIMVGRVIHMLTQSVFFGKIMNIYFVQVIFRNLHSWGDTIANFFFQIISPTQFHQLQHSLFINILVYTFCVYLVSIPLYNILQRYLARSRAKELFTELLDCCSLKKVRELK
ncbi:MAG: hypothetical protein GF308_05205 [Candidatus Heimdallarchaeota archaeon]|nr:hypothetical protein [Candidatus Heimdallarchaeota archaeon]